MHAGLTQYPDVTANACRLVVYATPRSDFLILVRDVTGERRLIVGRGHGCRRVRWIGARSLLCERRRNHSRNSNSK